MKEHWRIAPQRSLIEGEARLPALRVRRSLDADWELVPDEIEGYDHHEGKGAEIEVEIERVPDPPAGGSSLRHKLVRIVSRG